MKNKIVIIFLSGVTISYLLFLMGVSYLSEQDYKILTNKSSPNGKYVITEYRSRTEGGHAPYGQYLVLSPKAVSNDPDHGHVIFAGYCDPSPNYYWGSNSKIIIECKVDNDKLIQTSSALAFGINVDIVGIKKEPE